MALDRNTCRCLSYVYTFDLTQWLYLQTCCIHVSFEFLKCDLVIVLVFVNSISVAIEHLYIVFSQIHEFSFVLFKINVKVDMSIKVNA